MGFFTGKRASWAKGSRICRGSNQPLRGSNPGKNCLRYPVTFGGHGGADGRGWNGAGHVFVFERLFGPPASEQAVRVLEVFWLPATWLQTHVGYIMIYTVWSVCIWQVYMTVTTSCKTPSDKGSLTSGDYWLFKWYQWYRLFSLLQLLGGLHGFGSNPQQQWPPAKTWRLSFWSLGSQPKPSLATVNPEANQPDHHQPTDVQYTNCQLRCPGSPKSLGKKLVYLFGALLGNQAENCCLTSTLTTWLYYINI